MSTVLEKIISLYDEIAEDSGDESTPLIGDGACISSSQLVLLLVSVEDYCADTLGVTFDWTSKTAMSQGRSIYSSIGTLAKHVETLAGR